MYYNVAQLLKEPVGSTRTYGIEGPLPTDVGIAELLPQGQLSLMRTDKGILVGARVTVNLWVTCSRCLRRTSHPVDISIEEEYLPTIDISTGQSLRLPEKSEGTFTIDRQHGLDLREALRQYTLTGQPMKPLCIEDCRGICPNCGSDNNESSCSCSEGAMDPRWVPLTGLLEAYRN
jgi:uncharacterized protein